MNQLKIKLNNYNKPLYKHKMKIQMIFDKITNNNNKLKNKIHKFKQIFNNILQIIVNKLI